MTTGTEFLALFESIYDPASEAQPARERVIYQAVRDGMTPSWFGKNPWPEYDVARAIEGKTRHLRYRPSPFLAIGTDADWIMPPVAPSTLQAIASLFFSVMPSKRIVTDCFFGAEVKVPMQVPNGPPYNLKIPGKDMWLPKAFAAHSAMVRDKCEAALKAGQRVGGHSKDVVCGPRLTDKNLAIFGGFTGMIGPHSKPTDPPQVDGWAFQSYPGPHPASWIDYSQCGRVVFRRAYLDGQEVDLKDIFQDPILHPLVSDQGPFDPTYPNEPPRGSTVSTNLDDKMPPVLPTSNASEEDTATEAKVIMVLGASLLSVGALKKIFG